MRFTFGLHVKCSLDAVFWDGGSFSPSAAAAPIRHRPAKRPEVNIYSEKSIIPIQGRMQVRGDPISTGSALRARSVLHTRTTIADYNLILFMTGGNI